MTDLDLVCAEPYIIGLMGGISFLSFSIGSILMTRAMDEYGRKPTMLAASAITPIGIIIMLLFGNDIYKIYVIIFIMGLAYNTRSSAAYLFGTEFLCKESHIKYGQVLFCFSSLINILSALFFWLFRDQTSYFFFLFVIMMFSLIWIGVYTPESPLFLWEKENYDKLKICLSRIAKMNGKYEDEAKIDSICYKLQQEQILEKEKFV